MSNLSQKHIGHGIGLRPPHFAALLQDSRGVDWVEVISENFMVAGGNPRAVLRQVRARMPVALHGVSLSLGSVDPLDEDYLRALATLAREIEPVWISDHLCWSSFGGHSGHDLWPLPFTEEALAHVAARVAAVQERLGRRLLLENVSSYLQFADSALSEWEFLAALCARTGCGVLLDVNNVFVSAHNHGFSPRSFLEGIPVGQVGQIHLAGHRDEGTHLLDTHDHPVCPQVWDLYGAAVERFGAIPTVIERDDDIPPLAEVVAEARRAAAIEAEIVGRRSAGGGGMALADVQAFLYDLITAPRGVASGLEALGRSAADLAAVVRDGEGPLSAMGRLDVYADMYFYRILDVLRQEYPRLVATVGEAAFHDLVTDYLLAHRPAHPSLREVGAALPDYLRRHDAGAKYPWLAELARLERTHLELFDGADAPALALDEVRALGAADPARLASLSVRLLPNHALLANAFTLSPLWTDLAGDGLPDVITPPPSSPSSSSPPRRPEVLLVWRQGFTVRHRAVTDADEEAALLLAARGATIAALCERLADGAGSDGPVGNLGAPPVPAGAARAYQILATWVDDGLLGKT